MLHMTPQPMRTLETHQPLVIHNPNSTNSVLTDGIIDMIADDPRWEDPKVVETKYPDAMDNAKYLAEQIEEELESDGHGRQLAAWVCGGDGLSMSTANVMSVNPELRDSLLLMPLPVGNACDTSRSLYGGNVLRRGKFLDVMSTGEAYPASCIEATVNGIGRLGVAYAGFKCTADMSARFASSEWRNARPDVPLWPPVLKRFVDKRLADVRDAGAMVQGFKKSQPFLYSEAAVDPSATFAAHDILFNNQPMYARYGRIAVGVRGGSIMMEFPEGGFRRQVLASTWLGLVAGMHGVPTYRRELVIQSDEVNMHLDGEPFVLQKDDVVTIRDKPEAILVALPEMKNKSKLQVHA